MQHGQVFPNSHQHKRVRKHRALEKTAREVTMTDKCDLWGWHLSYVLQGHQEEELSVSKARAVAVVGESDSLISFSNLTKYDVMF